MITLKKTAVALVLGLLSLVSVEPVAASGGLRTVALSGEAAPGTGEGVNFTVLFGPVLNNRGETAFKASFFSNTGVNNDSGSGMFSEGSGNGLKLIARTGNIALANNQNTIINLFVNQPKISSNGQVAFEVFAGDRIGSFRDHAIFRSTSRNEVTLDALDGNTAPVGTDGVNFGSGVGVGGVVLNDLGQIAFTRFLEGTAVNNQNSSAIFSDAAGNGLALVARDGESAPDTGDNVIFGGLGSPVLNSKGEIAFSSLLVGSTVSESNNSGIFSGGVSSGLALVAREGEDAPGTENSVRYGDLIRSAPRINGSGQTAFRVTLTGTGVNDRNDLAIYSSLDDNGPVLVARSGQAAPGTGGNVTFSTFSTPVLDNEGKTIFSAGLTGDAVNTSNDTGIFRETSDKQLFLIAREGDTAPDTEDGVNFGTFEHTPILNARGQAAFLTALAGPNVDDTNDQGIFAENIDGKLQLVARKGDLLDVSDNSLLPELRQISSLFALVSTTGNEDGGPSGFNDMGQLAFSARFTDGSRGIFVSNLVVVPEPSSILLYLIAIAPIFTRRHRSEWVADSPAIT